MSPPAEVEGLGQMLQTLDAAADAIQDLDLDPVGGIVAGAARKAAPRRTGALAATVQAQVVGGIVHVTAGGPGVDYARPVHARNPWIARTITEQQTELLDTLTDSVNAELSKVHGD